MPAPSINSYSIASGSGTTTSVPAPSGVSLGDILTALEFSLIRVSPSAPSGWTEPSGGSQFWGTGGGFSLTVYYKVADSADVILSSSSGSYTFNTNGFVVNDIYILNVTGTTATSIDAQITFNTGSGTALVTGTVTTAQANELLIIGVGMNNGSGFSGGGFTGWTPVDSPDVFAGLSDAVGSAAQTSAGVSSTYPATAIATGSWVAVLLSIPTAPLSTTPLTQTPSQRFYPLQDAGDYRQEHSQRSLGAVYQPALPPTHQLSQQFHDRPLDAFMDYEQFRQVLPQALVSNVSPTQQPSQQYYPALDFNDEWLIHNTQIIASTYIPASPPTKQPLQLFYPSLDMTWGWYEQQARWPIPVQYVPTPPPSQQPSQQHYEQPDLSWVWEGQIVNRLPLPSSFMVSQEGVCGISNLMSGAGQSGISRVAQTAIEGYNVYIGAGELPDLQQSPTAFATALPISVPLVPPTSGLETFYILVRKQDRYGLESQNQYYSTVTMDSSGNEYEPPLIPPEGLQLYPLVGGNVRILASYPTALTDEFPATFWYVWESTLVPNSSDPPTYTFSVQGTNLQQAIGPWPPGTYYIGVALYRTSQMTQSLMIYGQVTIPSPPGEVVPVPSGFQGA